jgi:hypothetical protein
MTIDKMKEARLKGLGAVGDPKTSKR